MSSDDGDKQDTATATALATVDGHDLVRVATANGALEAQALKDYLKDHDILCHIQGLEHKGMLGNLGHFVIELHLLVPKIHAAAAAELVEAFRNAEPEFDEDDYHWNENDEGALEASELGKDRGVLGTMGRNLNTATSLAIVPSFGLGHMYTGAWSRGGILAITEIFGLAMLGSKTALGIALIALAVVVDLVGSRARIHALGPAEAAAPRPQLPRMRVVRTGANSRGDDDDDEDDQEDGDDADDDVD